MNIFLSWKKKFFSNTYQLYNNGIQSGFLKSSAWKQNSKGVLNDKEYDFITKGFFKAETTIFDSKTSEKVGLITYGNWKSKAILKKTSGEEYQFKYNNFWQTKWSLSNSYIFINYQGSTSKGELSATTDEELLLITGLFISNYYSQKRAGAVAAS